MLSHGIKLLSTSSVIQKWKEHKKNVLPFMMYYLFARYFLLIVCRMRNKPPKFHYQLHFYSVENNTKKTSREGQSAQQQRRAKNIELSFSISANHDM